LHCVSVTKIVLLGGEYHREASVVVKLLNICRRHGLWNRFREVLATAMLLSCCFHSGRGDATDI